MPLAIISLIRKSYINGLDHVVVIVMCSRDKPLTRHTKLREEEKIGLKMRTKERIELEKKRFKTHVIQEEKKI